MAKKRKDGRYQRKVTLSDGRQKIVYGKTLAELNAAADALRDEDRQGIKIGDNTLVGEWAKIWLGKYKSRCPEFESPMAHQNTHSPNLSLIHI